LVAQTEAVMEATDSTIGPYGAVSLAAFRGRETDATELFATAAAEVVRRGEGVGVTFVQWATAVLYNGLGRYPDAVAAAEQAAQGSHEDWFSAWGLVELIEAAIRSGRRNRAAEALELLTQNTAPSGSGWALGIEARSRALVTEGGVAETFYRE